MKLPFYFTVLAVVIVAILGLEIGYLLGASHSTRSASSPAVSASPSPNPAIFTAQLAEIQGQIIAVNGDDLSIVNSSGITSQFTASRNLMVYPASNTGKSSTGTSQIPIGQPAQIRLQLVGQQYQVTQIFLQQYSTPKPS